MAEFNFNLLSSLQTGFHFFSSRPEAKQRNEKNKINVSHFNHLIGARMINEPTL